MMLILKITLLQWVLKFKFLINISKTPKRDLNLKIDVNAFFYVDINRSLMLTTVC